MPVETPSLFAQAIQEHLELKRRNALLEGQMPISEYMAEDPFENHPLFKTEEQARVEDTMSGQESILREETSLDWPSPEDTFISEPEVERDDASVEFEAHGAANGEAPLGQFDSDSESEHEEPEAESDEGLWTRSRDFDWGD